MLLLMQHRDGTGQSVPCSTSQIETDTCHFVQLTAPIRHAARDQIISRDDRADLVAVRDEQFDGLVHLALNE